MPHLAKVSDLRARMGSLNDPNVNATLGAALDAAAVHIAAVLRTDFTRQIKKDIFWVDSTQKPFVGQFLYLKLSQGFVDSAETFEIRSSNYFDDIAAMDPLDLSFVDVNYPKGVVAVTASTWNGYQHPLASELDKSFVQVDYTCGFEVADYCDGEAYVGVPPWLKEAAILTAAQIARAGSCTPKKGSSGTNGCDTALIFLGQYIRYVPYAVDVMV